jgi:hypothetical protein
MLAPFVMLAAAALPLGVWPAQTGPAAATVDEIEFYMVEPEDDYSPIAVQALATPLRSGNTSELKRLAGVAQRLGADAVLLLGEMPERQIPDDVDQALPTTGRFSYVVFLSYDQTQGWDDKPAVPSAAGRIRRSNRTPLSGRVVVAGSSSSLRRQGRGR